MVAQRPIEPEVGGWRAIPLQDGQIRLIERLLSTDENAHWFAFLHGQTTWRQERVRVFGRWRLTPRLGAWHGDADAVYRYSGLTLRPAPWTEALLTLKKRVEAASEVRFNSVLLNYYRDGQDSMGWHSDDEPELGETPLIGSLSLGAARRLRFRHKTAPSLRKALELPGGSYLEMSGPTQRHWRHAVPKTTIKAGTGPRINLTFRTVVGAGYSRVQPNGPAN